MPALFVAAVAAAVEWVSGLTLASVAGFAARTLLTIGIAKLIANKTGSTAAGSSTSAGSRIQLSPSTDNNLPIIYGSAWISPIITDAIISTDQTTMWYVCALSEVPDSAGNFTFGDIYYDNRLCVFDGTDKTRIVSLVNIQKGKLQERTAVDGNLFMYLYNNGSSSGVNTSQTAIQVLQDSGIPTDSQWTSTDTMNQTCFIILKVVYNTAARLTNLGNIQVRLKNNLVAPGDVLLDYFTSSRYGCGIPTTQIDTQSLTDLNTYSNEYIEFTTGLTIAGITKDSPAQVKLSSNAGFADGTKIYIANVVGMTEINGGPYYTQGTIDPAIINLFYDANLTSPVDSTGYGTYVSGGNITAFQQRYQINGPIDTGQNCMNNLQQLTDACDCWLNYSELTGQWTVVIDKGYDQAPNAQTFNDLFLVDDRNLIGGINVNPFDLNSTFNIMEVQYPNTTIKDQTDFKTLYLKDYQPSLLSPNEPQNKLTIQFPQVNTYIQAVYLGIRRLLASRNDLVINFQLDYSGIQLDAGDVIRVTLPQYGWDQMLFRVTQVQEAKADSGNLGAIITAVEYNEAVYADEAIENYAPIANLGLTDPSFIGKPGTPTIATAPLTNGTVAGFYVTSTVPITTDPTNPAGTVLAMDFMFSTSATPISAFKLYTSITNPDQSPLTPGATETVHVVNLPPGTYYWRTVARNNLAGTTSDPSSSYAWNGPNVTTYNPGTGQGGITGNNVQYGSLYLNNFNPNLLVPEIIKSYKYEVANLFANTVVPPANVSTLGTFASGNWVTPKYMTQVYNGSDSSSYFPFYQGTSNTDNGYRANSTSSLNPAQSSQLIVANGDYNWWVLEYATTGSSNIVSTSQTLHISGKVQLVSNVNTLVQTLAFVTVSYPPDYVGAGVAKTDTSLNTIYLYANQPEYIEYAYDINGSVDINGGGIFIRQFNSANVIATGGSFLLSKTNQ